MIDFLPRGQFALVESGWWLQLGSALLHNCMHSAILVSKSGNEAEYIDPSRPEGILD